MSDDTIVKPPGEPEPPWPSFALPRGTIVNGYRLERVLGSGGFGITYLALDLLQQRFAIKEYYPRQFATRRDMTVRPTTVEDAPLFDECKDRFQREAQALVLLGRAAGAGEGIVRVQTYFEAFGTCFMVMDYVEGDSLADVLRHEPAGLSATRVRSLLAQLLSSVGIVHQAGLLHRDIKPANIILRDGDRLVLIDFGSTRQATPSESTTYTQIYSGGYGPPEQMLGLRQGEFSDIYAIGAVCYRAIGGSVIDALARQNALAAGRADPQPPAASIGAGRYPASLLTAVDAALAVDAAQRPQSVDAMLDILGPAGAPAAATSPRALPTPSRRQRRGPWLAAAALGSLAIAGAAYLALHGSTAPRPDIEARAPVLNPQPAPAGSPAPAATAVVAVPPAQQREAIATPLPVPVPAPPPPIVPTPLERARDAAGSVPCAALNLAAVQDGARVSGFAAAGQQLDRFLRDLQGAGRIVDDVTRIDRIACTVIDTLAPAIRKAGDGTAPSLALRLEQSNIPSGARLGIGVGSALPWLGIDLYQGDGTVHHLLRPTASGSAVRKPVEWIAAPPSGPRLVVAIGAASRIDLGARPETERETAYLDALRQWLADTSAPVAVDLAMVNVRAAEPVVAKVPQPRPATARSERCANIASRAQLGETLSDAELAALRTECRS